MGSQVAKTAGEVESSCKDSVGRAAALDMPIYLDYNATSPVAPRVITEMMPYFARNYGNASSSHPFGHEAHDALDAARRSVAALLNCENDEIVFTGGGSEANNLALKGVAMRRPVSSMHVITSVVDHPSVVKTCYYLAQRMGVNVTLVPVDARGRVDPIAVCRAITPQTALISIMLANNEVGTIQDIAEIRLQAKRVAPEVLIHSDAAQAVGKIGVDVEELGVDLLTIAAHKFCGPKGVGALFVRKGVELDPLIEGAGHEGGRRSGTENIAGIVGIGAAARMVRHGLSDESARLFRLKTHLRDIIQSDCPWSVVNSDAKNQLPNTLNISFPALIGTEVLSEATGVAASTGAACHSGSIEPSSVLLAMGLDQSVALGAIRLSIGRYTTESQIEQAGAEILRAVHALQRLELGSDSRLGPERTARRLGRNDGLCTSARRCEAT